jgi:elongation factor Tu
MKHYTGNGLSGKASAGRSSSSRKTVRNRRLGVAMLFLLAVNSVPAAEVADDASPDLHAFRMTVADSFKITGQGIVLTGVVAEGRVAVGDTVCLNSQSGEQRELKVAGLEQFRKLVDSVSSGENVGILFKELNKDHVQRGDELTGGC